MKLALKRAIYAYKIMLSGYFWGAAVLGSLFILATVNLERWNFAPATIDSLVLMHTVVMPIFTILLTANAFAEELEEHTFPMLWTYPTVKALLLFERILLLMITIAVVTLVSLIATHVWLLELVRADIWLILKTSMPVHLFFLGITLLCSLLGRNMLVGLAVGGVYWLSEMISRGLWTKKLFLFQPIWPIVNVSEAINRGLVIGTGLLLLGVTTLIFMYGRHWIAKKR